jgi:hypothetical protein
MTFFLFIILLIFPPKVQAYLDPGTGSYITQLLIGGLVGGGYLVKVYFHKIINFFKKNKSKDEK